MKKITKGINIYRRSPVKKDTLQKYVKATHGHELQLLGHTKTRWNALLAALKRRYLLDSEVSKANIDLRIPEMSLTENEKAMLKDLIDILETLEVGSVNISGNACSLLEADQIMEFTLNKLAENKSEIGEKMHEIFTQRLNERRNLPLIGVLSHLSLNASDNADIPSRNDIIKKIRDLYVRLFWSPESETEPQPEITNATDEPVEKKSKVEELKEFLDKKRESAEKEKNDRATMSTQASILTEIRREFAILENTGERPNCLEKVFSAVSTMAPTSVEAERAFSAAGLFITKIRARLGDEAIDKLCFLRHHLLKTK